MDKLTEEELYNILNNHDWSYSYSDDFKVWDRGQKSLDKIKKCLQEVKENQPELLQTVKKFYDNNVTDEFRKHFFGGSGYYKILENYFKEKI